MVFMNFLDRLQENTNQSARTLNGAVTNNSSLNANLDYFALAGAMRDRPTETRRLFSRAYASDMQTVLRTLFYLRDIRGGQGEREVFREGLKELENLNFEVAIRAIEWVAEYGRYDDLFVFNKPEVKEAVTLYIKKQLAEDEKAMANGEPVSLLAKWMPSVNTSSKKTRELANRLAKELDLKPSQYRKKLSALRKYIKLLEHQMTNKQWSEIDYSKVPSQASRKHVKAFMRNDEDRFREFLSRAEKGEVKMNTSTLYTYEVYDLVRSGQIDAANAMWNNLPDYTNGSDALVVADVSGSMIGRPMSVSVSLALYFAERNKGRFKNKFMTFSETPEVVDVVGSSLSSRMNNIERAAWGFNTDLEAVFDVILQSAEQAEGDMPKVLYIISDMEFDYCVSNANRSVFDNAKDNFRAEGLELPHVVFWNVNSHQNQAPATKFDNNVTLISGLSQSTFKYAVEGKTPLESMQEVVNSERYAIIKV